MGLLCLRTTPVDHQIKSPAELLFGRKLKSNLPGKITNTLDDKNIIHENYWNRQNSQKSYHDVHCKGLNTIETWLLLLIPGHVFKEIDTRCGEG